MEKTIYKCDRCGKTLCDDAWDKCGTLTTVKQEVVRSAERVKLKHRLNFFRKSVPENLPQEVQYGVNTFDLCSECSDLFFEWMKGEK